MITTIYAYKIMVKDLNWPTSIYHRNNPKELYQRLRHMVDGESSEHVQLDVLLLAAVDECVSGKLDNIQSDFFNCPPLFRVKMKKANETSQEEALSDEGFHGTAASVGSLACFHFGTEKITLCLVSFLDPCRAILQFFPKCFSTPQHGAQHCRVLYFPGISIIIKNVKYHDNNIKVDIYVWLF